jgi:LPPG:FO 2-phospho-L-lactate transferase
MIVGLSGGVGGARMLRGLVLHAGSESVTAVVNVGDDFTLGGLSISPDLDTVCYTLAGLADEERGWGLSGERWEVMAALERLGGPTWFRLGDHDLATHLFRTDRLVGGAPLSRVTRELAEALGVPACVLPATDDPLRTVVELADGRSVGFQEYFVRLGHSVPVRSIRFDGTERARPAPGVLERIRAARVVVVCPSNPLLSVAPILAVDGIEAALRARRDHTVAVSPIVGGRALKGPADRLLVELGHPPGVVGVARMWAPIASTLVLDRADAHLAEAVAAEGIAPVFADTIMTTPERAAALAAVVLDAAQGGP